MKIRHIALGIILSMFVAGPGFAANSNINTNTQNNTNTNNSASGFGSSFEFSNDTGNGSIRQEVSDNDFRQCFFFNAGFFVIVQIIDGPNFSQRFLPRGAENPCLSF